MCQGKILESVSQEARFIIQEGTWMLEEQNKVRKDKEKKGHYSGGCLMRKSEATYWWESTKVLEGEGNVTERNLRISSRDSMFLVLCRNLMKIRILVLKSKTC